MVGQLCLEQLEMPLIGILVALFLDQEMVWSSACNHLIYRNWRVLVDDLSLLCPFVEVVLAVLDHIF